VAADVAETLGAVCLSETVVTLRANVSWCTTVVDVDIGLNALAGAVVGVAVLLVAELSLATSYTGVVFTGVVTAWNRWAFLTTASLDRNSTGRAGSVKARVAREGAAARVADTDSVFNGSRALTVERASRGDDHASASGSVELGVAQAIERASALSGANGTSVGDVSGALVVASALSTWVGRARVNVSARAHRLSGGAWRWLGQTVRVTELVGVVRATTRRGLGHSRRGGKNRGSNKSKEFEARHCCCCCCLVNWLEKGL